MKGAQEQKKAYLIKMDSKILASLFNGKTRDTSVQFKAKGKREEE